MQKRFAEEMYSTIIIIIIIICMVHARTWCLRICQVQRATGACPLVCLSGSGDPLFAARPSGASTDDPVTSLSSREKRKRDASMCVCFLRSRINKGRGGRGRGIGEDVHVPLNMPEHSIDIRSTRSTSVYVSQPAWPLT